ncbi:hypothetical protein ACWGUN_01745 [Streptomyces koyangensis]|uniref:hypothetical protein n=1 Tax=Streptomyces diastaticus TaxID=1956 RepID=UPI003664143F
MMPHPKPAMPICGNCDGFPVVHITTGTTTPTGHRHTLPATCPTCHGTGHRTTRRTTIQAGR